MTDAELVDAFERGTVVPEDFGHRQHVRLTWLYLARHGRVEAERRLLHGLRALAARAGKPDRFSAPLTRVWVARIADAAAALGADHSFEDLLGHHPGLLDRTAAQAPAPTL
jgi:hypothetical protein